MTGSQNFSSHPISNTCPFGQASALVLCNKDNTDLLSFDKPFLLFLLSLQIISLQQLQEELQMLS